MNQLATPQPHLHLCLGCARGEHSLARNLRENGYLSISNGELAGAFSADRPTKPNLLLKALPIVMAQAEILELQSCRQHHPECHLILLTSPELYHHPVLQQLQIHGYLPLDAQIGEVLACLLDVMAGLIYRSPQLLGKPSEEPLLLKIKRLTPREQEVLDLMRQGKRTKAIAEALSVRQDTIKNHKARIVEKLGLPGMTELYEVAAQWKNGNA